MSPPQLSCVLQWTSIITVELFQHLRNKAGLDRLVVGGGSRSVHQELCTAESRQGRLRAARVQSSKTGTKNKQVIQASGFRQVRNMHERTHARTEHRGWCWWSTEERKGTSGRPAAVQMSVTGVFSSALCLIDTQKEECWVERRSGSSARGSRCPTVRWVNKPNKTFGVII